MTGLMTFFMTATPAPEVPADSGGFTSMLWSILPFAAIIVVFYFLLIRPESKRKKEVNRMRSELVVGDEITTIGGIIGKIVNIKDDEITIETGSDKVRLKFMRWAISAKGAQASEKGGSQATEK